MIDLVQVFFGRKPLQMKSAFALRRNQILMIQMRTMPLQYHPSWHRCWTIKLKTCLCSRNDVLQWSCLQTNQSLFLPKFSTGAEWNADFQTVKRCSGLEVSKVCLEALGEWQVICVEKKLAALFQEHGCATIRNLACSDQWLVRGWGIFSCNLFLSINFGSNSHQIAGSRSIYMSVRWKKDQQVC